MKSTISLLQKRTQALITLILLLISIPIQMHGQINHKDLVIFLTCVEDLGNGQHLAYFGYENPNAYVVNVAKKDSYLQFNGANKKTSVLNEFQSGIYERAFSTAFDSDGQVLWHVRTNTYEEREVVANSFSELCPALNIIPYYDPPEGGKVFESKIGAELTSLYETYSYDPLGFNGVSDNIYQLDGTKVLIEVVAEDDQYSGMISALNGLRFDLATVDPILNRATGWLEIGDLLLLNDMIPLNYARPVFTGINDKIVGQGDVAMRSDYTRMGFYGMGIDPEVPFNLDGSLVRVGVISNSYNTKRTAHIDVEQDDLPGEDNTLGYEKEVAVLKDIITPEVFSLSDEGRAMMQIIHDIAPGAELVFRTGYLGELDMAQGIRDLADPDDKVTGNCDIIVDDITYITEPFFRDGIISQAIDDVVGNVTKPVCYFSSAGNFKNYSYHDVFQAGSPLAGIAEEPHNFGTESAEDILQLISLDAGTYTLVLQWDDGSDPDQAVTNTDLDIFLTHDDGTTLFGFNRVNTGEAPVEVLPFTVLEDGVFTNILINKADGPDFENLAFKYVIFRGGAGFHFEEDGHDAGSSTIVGHANAEGTMAVGAVLYHHTPAYGESIEIEDYSSWGGSPIMTYTVDNPTSVPIYRDKPDFTAPDGVNTSVFLNSEGGNDYVHETDPDALPNFLGTSAAAPHAAGAAALIIQARRSFDNGNNTAPDDIRNLMRNTAIGNEEYDPVSGYGFIQPYAAIRTFANPRPEIEAIIYDGVPPSETQNPITFTLEGNFYINEANPDEHTEIHIRGEVLTSGVEIQNEHTIVVTHSFIGNPAIQAINPPTDGGPVTDGGSSDPIYFLDTPIIDIEITARDFTKQYGEALPYFTTAVLPDETNPEAYYNTTINFDDFAPGEKGRILDRLSFDVNATSTSVAGVPYVIDLVFAPADPDEELDHAIDEKYNITLVQGNLIVKKLPLTITPQTTAIGYGQVLSHEDIIFDYTLGSSDIDPINRDAILAELEVRYNNPLPVGVPMVNGIALVRGTALVNVPEGNPVEVDVVEENNTWNIYIDDILYNGQPLPRGIALVNDLPFVQIEEIIDGVGLFNGDEVSIVRDNGVSYLTAVGTNDPPIAVHNGIALVRGTALVNGVEVKIENGAVYVNGAVVIGTALVNGIPVVRGTALVNSEHIVRGVALVNHVRGTALVNIEIPVFSGIPDIDGNNEFNLGAIAMVNGIPMVRGTALVNGINASVDVNGDIEVSGEEEPFAFVNGIALVRGTALVNGISVVRGTALVNGKNLVRGTALVNNVPDDLNITNMNFLASTNSLKYLDFVNGTPLVNSMLGVDGIQLEEAADPFTNSFTSVRGIALVNGQALVSPDGAIVNVSGSDYTVRGTALVNEAISTTVGEESNLRAIVINHDAEVSSSYIPVTFITGTDVGTHAIVPGTFLSNNFNISYGLGDLIIEKAELEITASDNQSMTYGQTDPTFTIKRYNLDGDLVEAENDPMFDGEIENVDLYGSDALSGSLERVTGEDVGSYAINIGDLTAGPNYNLTFVPGTFTISQASLIIWPGNNGKDYDDPNPPSVIDRYELDGVPNSPDFDRTIGDVDLYYSDVLTGSLSRETGEDVGSYGINGPGNLTAGANYNISLNLIDQPRFYINPYGPGTRAIKPELNCVERLPSGLYIANLEYRNGNAEAVYIPAGSENNLLTGTGIFWEMSDPVPSLFEPDGGAFQVYFDGTELSWVVNSLDEDHKVSSAANANSNSTKCKKTKSAQVSGVVQEEELDPDQILVYPNPVTDKVHITMKDIEHYKMIELFDMTGRVHPITSIDKRTDNLEIDMVQLSPGYYFIKIVMDSSTKVVQLIKE